MAKSYSLTDARKHLGALLRDVERRGAVRLTRRGQPVAVVTSIRPRYRANRTRGGLWEALQRFHNDPRFRGVDIDPSIFEGLRDGPEPDRPNPWL